MKKLLLALLLMGNAPFALAQGFQPSKEACGFSVAELETTLGIKVEEGKGSEMAFSGGKQLTCTYRGRGVHSLVVTQMRMGDPAALSGSYDQFKAGTMEPIVGDQDRARWQLGQGDLTDVSLHYLRAGTSVQVRVRGVDMKKADDVDTMRKRVVKLRRLP